MVLTQDAPPLIDVRPDVPRALSDAVMACLSKDPEMRPSSAKAVLAMLDGMSTGSGETQTHERRAIPRVHITPSTPETTRPVVISTPVTNPPVSKTPVSNTPVSNAPMFPGLSDTVMSAPVSSTPESNAPVTSTPPDEQFAVADGGEGLAAEVQGVQPDFDADGYEPPKKKSKKMLVGGIVVALAAAGAIYVATQSGGSSAVVPPAAPAPAVAESAAVQTPPGAVAALPAAASNSVAVAAAPKLDSLARADSVRKAAAAKKAAAKADSLKKVAATADSVKHAQNTTVGRARTAAAGMLSNASARATFTEGATHMGGVLGTKRMGDLQTQINALVPFLTQAGLTYEQFKGVVKESGINIYDEFGRIVPDSLRRFAGVSR